MALATASTKLAKFDHILNTAYSTDTTVETLKAFRGCNFDGDQILDLLEPDPFLSEHRVAPSRRERLRRLIHGAPKMRETLKLIRKVILPDDELSDIATARLQKQLITEDIPAIAWYWELVLNFVHIPTQVLHSDLTDAEREHVVGEFKRAPQPGDLTHLSVMILMYTINASGINLDTDCHRVIVNTAATSTPVEVQAWSRVVRVSLISAALQKSGYLTNCNQVSQKEQVNITRLSVVNSHDEYRDSVQASKTLIDTACKTYARTNLKTMADVLNDSGRKEIKHIQEDTALGRKRKYQYDNREADEDKTGLGHNPMIVETVDQDPVLGLDNDEPSDEEFGREDEDDEFGDEENAEEKSDDGEDDEDVLVASHSNDARHAALEMILRPIPVAEYPEVDDNDGDGNYIDEGPEASADDEMDPSNDEDLEDLQDHATSKNPGRRGKVLLDPEDAQVDWRKASEMLEPFTLGSYKTLAHSTDQTDIYYCHIATLDKDRIYDAFAVENEPIALERALRLLHRIRYGQFEANLRITPYIDYGAIPEAMMHTLTMRIIHEKSQQPVPFLPVHETKVSPDALSPQTYKINELTECQAWIDPPVEGFENPLKQGTRKELTDAPEVESGDSNTEGLWTKLAGW
jgi:hypothetical protein